MKKLWVLLLMALFLTGCGGDRQGTGETAQPTTNGAQAVPETTLQAPATAVSGPETTRESTASTTGEPREDTAPSGRTSEPQYGYTYGQASGSHVVEGTGRLSKSEPVDVQLDGVPTWIVGVPLRDDTAWIATLEDGGVQAFRLNDEGETESVPISPDRFAPGQPPLVEVQDGSLELVTSRNEAASKLTHPVPVSPDGGKEQLGVEAGGPVFEEVSESDSVGIGENRDHGTAGHPIRAGCGWYSGLSLRAH